MSILQPSNSIMRILIHQLDLMVIPVIAMHVVTTRPIAMATITSTSFWMDTHHHIPCGNHHPFISLIRMPHRHIAKLLEVLTGFPNRVLSLPSVLCWFSWGLHPENHLTLPAWSWVPQAVITSALGPLRG